MSDDKPPTQRLGRLTSEVGKSKDGGRLGSLRGDGAEAGTSAGAGGSGLTARFRPKNFTKVEGGPVPEIKLAEPLPDANARRSNNRPSRGGRGGAGGIGGNNNSRGTYESEVVFGGIVGAGAIGKTDMRSKVEPEFKPEPPSPTGTTQKTTKRLVKASGAAAGGAAAGSKQKKGMKSDSDTESLCSTTDEEDDDDLTLGEDDEYLPTLLSALGKNNPGSGSGAAALASLVPEELMSRPAEDETALNRQLAWLTEPDKGNAGLVLFQLPSVLPIPVPHQSNGVVGGGDGVKDVDLSGSGGTGAGVGPSTSAAAAAAAAMAADGRPASLAELPPGKIGKLLVLRNGSVKMQVGEVLFDVSPGIPCQMLQEFAAIDPSAKTITMLGEIEKRIVVTPNIDSLLSDEPLPEWKYAAEYKNGVSVDANGAEAGAAAANKKKSGGGRGAAVLIDSDSSEEEKEDKEMVDAANGREKNGVVAMSEDEEEIEEEKEPKKKSRPPPKSRKESQRSTRK